MTVSKTFDKNPLGVILQRWWHHFSDVFYLQMANALN